MLVSKGLGLDGFANKDRNFVGVNQGGGGEETAEPPEQKHDSQEPFSYILLFAFDLLDKEKAAWGEKGGK